SRGGGEGYESFTIRPRREAATGDIANAKATIVFDLNQPIETPPIFNTIDAGLPVSNMAGYSGVEESPQVELFWSAHDDPGGSGVRDYALYASKDNEPFQLYQSGLTGTSLIYPREEGHTYRFFVVASDQAGNVEASKQSAEIVVSTEPEGVELPRVFALGQNYPNPFNPTTTIPFDVAEAGDVEVVMYDVLGRRVEMLALGFMQPGRYRQQFNLGEYASGVYFYELRVRDGSSYRFRDVKRLVLVK
ncbi:MAG: T9SS type A sorting domain-containing protein, partial [Rhodothermales bacterium]